MQSDKTTIRVPGKLMIAGEFAVLEVYQKCLVMAVDRYIYTEIYNSNENRVSLLDFGLQDIPFSFQDNRIVLQTDDPRKSFVEQAMTLTFRYLAEAGITPKPFQLSIHSELDDKSGVKYGLGSSAAVTTGVVTAILSHCLSKKLDKKVIFKLAALTHVIIQGNGSGADIAASCYGALIQYSSFQAEWLLKEWSQTKSVRELVEKNWIYLSIEPLPAFKDVYFCVGWTKKAASTAELVNYILELKRSNRERFLLFIQQSSSAVKKMVEGLQQKKPSLLIEGTKENRRALADIGREAGVEIETDLLRTLSDLAEEFGGAGKPSGAGGGDCGIGFMTSKEGAQNVIEAWEQQGIRPLNIQPDMNGASVINEKN